MAEDEGMGSGDPAQRLAFRARALAQAHPLSDLARRFVDGVVARQRLDQPLPEIGIWAGAALVGGYCLRRVEESADELGAVRGAWAPKSSRPGSDDLERLDEDAARLAAMVRRGETASFAIGDPLIIEAALDRLVHSAVTTRLQHWEHDIDEAAWAELEEYLTWWTVKGYALRVAETHGDVGSAVLGERSVG